MILDESGAGAGCARPSLVGRLARGRAGGASLDDQELVACASGNLALLYLMVTDERVDREEIEELYPDLIDGLLAHPGVAVVIVHSAANGPVALDHDGEHYLASGRIVGVDPLAPFGPHAADSLRRLDGFENAGDLAIIGPYDEGTGEVVSFEDLVGSHGGLGGRQQEPFLLHPVDLPIGAAPLVGAPSVHAELTHWLASLQTGGPLPASDPVVDHDQPAPTDERPRLPTNEPVAAAVAVDE